MKIKDVYGNDYSIKDLTSFKNHIIKLTVFLIDLKKFQIVNNLFEEYFKHGYPSRSVVEVSALPLSVNIEIEAIGSLI